MSNLHKEMADLKKDLEQMRHRVNRISKLVDKAVAASTQKPKKKPKNFSQKEVLSIIQEHKKIFFSDLFSKTSLTELQVRRAIYLLTKSGNIKSPHRGYYEFVKEKEKWRYA